MKAIEKIEDRFLEVAGFCRKSCDLREFPLVEGSCPQTETDKEKSALHGEVFTPLWFVDKMILKAADSFDSKKITHDLCAGFGQFTIRMLRFLANKEESFKPNLWLKNKHSFSEYKEGCQSMKRKHINNRRCVTNRFGKCLEKTRKGLSSSEGSLFLYFLKTFHGGGRL